jgi:hypothetical protein
MMLAIERSWATLVLSSFAGSSHAFRAGGDVDYFAAAARFMDAASEKACLGLRLAVLIAVTAPFWMWGRLRALSSFSPEERSRLLDELLRHRIFFVRELVLLLKLVACMAIFRSAEASDRVNFGGRKKKLLVVGEEAA